MKMRNGEQWGALSSVCVRRENGGVSAPQSLLRSDIFVDRRASAAERSSRFLEPQVGGVFPKRRAGKVTCSSQPGFPSSEAEESGYVVSVDIFRSRAEQQRQSASCVRCGRRSNDESELVAAMIFMVSQLSFFLWSRDRTAVLH